MNFLQKYKELVQSIPVRALSINNSEDCNYTDITSYSKNCYHCFIAIQLVDALYCFACVGKKLADCHYCVFCENCYQCVDINNCYNCIYLNNCTNCRDSYFCNMCINCSDCFGCVALTRKKYCIYNKQYSKEEYQKKIIELKLQKPEDILIKLESLIKKTPQPQSHQYKNENCPYGDYINNSKNVYWAFNSYWVEDSGYIFIGGTLKDCWDVTYTSGSTKDIGKDRTEMCYEVIGGASCYNSAFLNNCGKCSDCYYCTNMRNCSDCFGCVGLDNKKYCILNNQLTQSEYEKNITLIKEELGWAV